MRVGCRVDGVCVNNISYADDMVLLGPTARSVEEMLKVCADYAASHGLRYNIKKCEYIVFKAAGNNLKQFPEITLNGMNIKKLTSFKYLGHYVTDVLKDNADIERERRALAVRGQQAGVLKGDWAGHVCRMPDESWAKATTEWIPNNLSTEY
ncbi:uncharacterized protein LOC113229728 [Hyposmocoma kahamanoa]|uniref:uncharacterized protein LOC113229728 n=1 Tax=Hyposmocoma kahamanoa TaxID=1477025 RepID=UPI000E6D5E6E|nr:uncharacterized protein LOC113229728 [Hyposmocoma kahamanoa]